MLNILLFIFLINVYGDYNKKYKNAGVYLNSVKCNLHPRITPDNVLNYSGEINNTIASICGLNNGIFTLEPTGDKTYGCSTLPSSWNFTINTILDLEPKKIIYYLDILIEGFFNTSGYQQSACVGSVSYLTCNRENPWKYTSYYDKIKGPIRGVNIGGLFVLERWILPDFTNWGENGVIDQYTFSKECAKLGNCDVLINHWETFYNQNDFYDMKKYGINMIRLPVGYWYFTEISGFKNKPYIIPQESIYDSNHPITKIINYANNAGLYITLDLHGAPGSQNGFDNSGETTQYMSQPDVWGQHWIYNPENINGTIETNIAMIKYIKYIESEYNLNNVIILELLNEPYIDLDISLVKKYYIDAITEIRKHTNMTLFIHDSFRGVQWNTLLKDWPFENVYMDTHSYQCFGLSNVASDTSDGDKLKMYMHEMESCGLSNVIHYETCLTLPTVVGEWSLAIDDCINYLNAQYQNVGQCDRMNERINSPIWNSKYKSYAMRQINTFEKELGWFFWTWKLSEYAEKYEIPSSYYWSFSLAVKHDYINLFDNSNLNACDFDVEYPILSSTVSSTSNNNSNIYLPIVVFLLSFILTMCLIYFCYYKGINNNIERIYHRKKNYYSIIPNTIVPGISSQMNVNEN